MVQLDQEDLPGHLDPWVRLDRLETEGALESADNQGTLVLQERQGSRVIEVLRGRQVLLVREDLLVPQDHWVSLDPLDLLDQ